MKKLVGLLLTCTAFAYSGERIVMELPPEISGSREFQSPTSLNYKWTAEEEGIEITNAFQDPEKPFTVESYLAGDLEVLEIIEQSANSATLISTHLVDASCCSCSVSECDPSEAEEVTFCEKVIVTDDCYHIVKSENLDWLSYVQTAEVGESEPQQFYRGQTVVFDHEGWFRMVCIDEANGLFQTWFNEADQSVLTTISGPLEDDTLDIMATNFAEGMEEQFTVTSEVIQEDDSERIMKFLMKNNDLEILCYCRFLVTEQYAHLVFAIGQEEEILLDTVESVELS